MTLLHISETGIENVPATSFGFEGVKERQDLQRLLLNRIDFLDPDLFVITEEFGDWEDSKRRIDILCIDKDAKLVVIELKRTEDGGHMELQALRYAAMISTMTFESIVSVHAKFLQKNESTEDAKDRILGHLEWDEPDEDNFGKDVRVILVAANFSKEVTTTVLWLNNRMLDIQCFRIQPYRFEKKILLDVQQLIPLPETSEYQIKIKEKEQAKLSQKWQPKDWVTIWELIRSNCSDSEVAVIQDLHDWLKPLTSELFPTQDGFAALIKTKNLKHFPLKISVKGQVQIWFYYLKRKPPFIDELLRQELILKLNSIEGVNISETKIAGKPSFPVKILENTKAMDQFKSVLTWILQKIKECPEA
jgi:hypothetical protein